MSFRSLRSYSLDRSLATINPAGCTPDNFYPKDFVGIVLLSVPFRIEYLDLFIAMNTISPIPITPPPFLFACYHHRLLYWPLPSPSDRVH